ncbi:MAG: DUF4381 domain-containing protein [Candidatus Eisenbacteria bacterium]
MTTAVSGPVSAHATDFDSTLTEPPGDQIPVQVTLSPNIAKIGERVTYRARVIGYMKVEWLPPEPDSIFTWGVPRSGRSLAKPPARRYGKQAATPPGTPSYPRPDTSWIEIPLQAFSPGILPVPGLRFRATWSGTFSPMSNGPFQRVPMTRLIVVGIITPADSAKGLRDVHGPLPAPWWERVPWRWVAGGVALLALVVAWWMWARRARRPVPVVAATPVRRDPLAEALAELRALRGLHLPEHGRFAEHAFRLGQILRRYLEATVPLTRPGDSTPELVTHLRGGGLAVEDLQRLTALLRLWDRVKFAREPLTVEEAARSEDAVESYVRAREPVAAGGPGRVA